MKGRTLCSLLILLVISSQLFSQRVVEGVVKDAETKEPLLGATIILYNHPQGEQLGGTYTDLKGKFSLQLPAGDFVIHT